MKTKLDEKLAHIQEKSWAEPLGQAMSITGNIVDTFGSFIPGASILAGALEFGAELLNPDPTIENLQEDLKAMTIQLANTNSEVTRAIMQSAKDELIKKIEEENQRNRNHVQQLIREVTENQLKISDEIDSIRSKMRETFMLIMDMRYKVRTVYQLKSVCYRRYFRMDSRR